MKIKFLGAAMSVTGSCHLVTTDKYKFLLDCGQFQGDKILEQLNFKDLEFDPAELDFMVLSHAHVDHCGRIPLLTNLGFKGKIYCTHATSDLTEIMLKDSGHIHEVEAEWANKKAMRQGRNTVVPLFTVEDAIRSLQHLSPIGYDKSIDINQDITIRLQDAGHILGSSIVELWVKEGEKSSKLVFSGDLGTKDKPILRDPVKIEEADYLIMETTYGNRVHEPSKQSLDKLIKIILKTIRRGGTVVIPSFAVGRTQELVYHLNRYYDQDEECKRVLRDVMVYVDSPMATNATEVFRKHAEVFDEETKNLILSGDNPLDFKNLRFTRSSEESRQLNYTKEPKIIISASGMCDEGRIKHHLKHNLWNPKSSIIIIGYQAEGTLGKFILDGNKDVRIFGENIHIKAEIHNLEGFSGHADRDDLLEWLSGFKSMPKKVFLLHGEEEAKHAFADTVKQALLYECTVVEDVSEYDLESDVRLSIKDTRSKASIGSQIIKAKDKLYSIHNDFEDIINLATEKTMNDEKMNEASNMILRIEEMVLKLKSLMGEGD
ncbi:ribonuclease [Andreesenia angusta]|uniref:Ribonuclease n=1 Tax=Andreesenia angusta TaxID=39480 RepID=A0A1S1VAG3_9FIRM|nr:MBL fold metallo-hydrolase [Andreesenia angusta]OHW63420.1 ribonuclease [Andreesenia angusta]